MTEYEKWLHQYRKLDRTDATQHFRSVNYTDPRLRHKRELIQLLNRLYLSEASPAAQLQIVEHLIRTN
jgi:hypothetical protein